MCLFFINGTIEEIIKLRKTSSKCCYRCCLSLVIVIVIVVVVIVVVTVVILVVVVVGGVAILTRLSLFTKCYLLIVNEFHFQIL